MTINELTLAAPKILQQAKIDGKSKRGAQIRVCTYAKENGLGNPDGTFSAEVLDAIHAAVVNY